MGRSGWSWCFGAGSQGFHDEKTAGGLVTRCHFQNDKRSISCCQVSGKPAAKCPAAQPAGVVTAPKHCAVGLRGYHPVPSSRCHGSVASEPAVPAALGNLDPLQAGWAVPHGTAVADGRCPLSQLEHIFLGNFSKIARMIFRRLFSTSSASIIRW